MKLFIRPSGSGAFGRIRPFAIALSIALALVISAVVALTSVDGVSATTAGVDRENALLQVADNAGAALMRNYGPLQLFGRPFEAKGGEPDRVSDLVQIDLSDEEFRDMFARVWGQEAAEKVHRVKKPLATPAAALGRRYATMTNEYSLNYCGYRTEVGGVCGVKGTFNVRYNTSGTQATWVGLGGTSTILQAGIDGQLHKAWVEAYPAPPMYLFNVNNSDTINVSVGKDVYTGRWYVSIWDATTGNGWGAAYTGTVEPKGNWIVEAPDLNLGRFGTISFSNCKWWNSSGTNYRIDYGTGYYFKTRMVDRSGRLIVAPSALGGGSAFSVTR